ncbi:MAG: hypothetical protein ACLGH0_12655 [Thermoanaerobaculia bacterium]
MRKSYEVPAVLDLMRQIAARYGGDQGKPALTEETILAPADKLAVRALLDAIPRFPFAIKDTLLTFQFPQWKEIARACGIRARPLVSLRHPVASAHRPAARLRPRARRARRHVPRARCAPHRPNAYVT